METSHYITILENAVRRCHLPGATLLVGVSGGADSLALLHGLAQLAELLELRLIVSHFDHRLRPESAEDARFVQEVAQSLELPARVGSAEVRSLARDRGMGIEEAARHARLRFFADLAGETGAAAVALGHTRDDQSETRLLHLVRGTGLRGLIGMAEDSTLTVDERAIRVFRPLLAVGRADTVAFCAARSLEPREDRTNRDLAYSRNRIRHAIVPPMRALNPRLDEALERLGRSARAAEEFVEAELDRRLPDIVDVRESGWTIRRQPFRDLPEALKRALVRRAAEDAGATVGAESIETTLEAANSWPAGTRIAWPDGREVRIEHDWLSIGQRLADQPNDLTLRPTPLPLSDTDLPLQVPPSLGGRERSAEAVLRVRRRSSRCARPRDFWHADFDARRLPGSLGVRGRHPGDRVAPEGLGGTKKLQDLLVDAHIPRRERDLVPLLTAGDTVAWVIGLRRNRDCLAGPDCDQVLCCEVVQMTGDTCLQIC